MPELAGDVDHGTALVELKRGERMAEIVWTRVLQVGAVE